MYTDTDSILYQDHSTESNRTNRWFSCVEEREMSREDLCVLYGCWADDAARSGFLTPVDAAC